MADKNNTLTWLHLSDIHFHCSSEWQGKAVRDKLLKFLAKRFDENPSLKPDIIFCTGDIAFGETSGSKLAEQYQKAREFFDGLLRLCGLDKERLLVVPGNHDIDRNAVDPMAQDTFSRWAQESRAQQHSINQMFETYNISIQGAMNRLVAYSQFIADYLPHQIDDNARCVYHQNLTINNINLGVFGFNSAWSCAGNNDDRHLWLAAHWQFNLAQQNIGDSQIRVGLIHHPHDWFNETEREIIPNRSESGFDFMLHGHTHNSRITNSNGLVTLGAGATGAHHDEEFGINITQVDLNTATGNSHLYTFSTKHHGWLKYIVPEQADDGVWPLTLKPSLKVEPAPEPVPEIAAENQQPPTEQQGQRKVIVINRHKLYGRDGLLKKTAATLQQKSCLLIYGMRGNGKSAFIEALLQQAPLQGAILARTTVNNSSTCQSLYQLLASHLGDKSDAAELPQGDLAEIKRHLHNLKPHAVKAKVTIWLENAHLLFSGDKFKDDTIKNLVVALRQVHPNWIWLFELRERPQPGTVVNSEIVAIEGLVRADLGQLLKDAGPAADNDAGDKPWHYNAKDLKVIYGWLGGGHGKHAHPQATQLLVTVARELKQTPYEVLKSHIGDFEKQLEAVLLGDLYYKVLNQNEQGLFATMALYRDYVPVDHIESLENTLNWPAAFEGLNLRCLITSGGESEYYLHGFFKAWLRGEQGYNLDEEQYQLMPTAQVISDSDAQQIKRQQTIADLWQQEVTGKKRITQLNIRRTNEALFHAIHAGQYHYAQELTSEMLGASSDLVYERLYARYQYLFNNKASVVEQCDLLNLLVKLKPQESKLYRFLASTWKQIGGWEHQEVLKNIKMACKLLPSQPEYWANYGKACLGQKNHALVKQFLIELAQYQQQCQHQGQASGIDDFVQSVRADCQVFLGDEQGAFANREQMIAECTDNPAVYVDQINFHMQQQQYQQALEVIAKAQQNNAYNQHTSSIEGRILSAMGDDAGAEHLLLAKVNDGVSNPAIYVDLAQLYLRQSKHQQALDVVAKAQQNRTYNQHTSSIEGRILSAMGDDAGAEHLLLAKVNDGVSDPVFYVDLAQLYLRQGKLEAALGVVDKAKTVGATDEYTVTIEAKIRRAMR